MDHPNESYYNDLQSKITEFKTKNNQCTHSRTLSFIENVSNCRSKVPTRGDSLVLGSMELEYQTYIKMRESKMKRIKL